MKWDFAADLRENNQKEWWFRTIIKDMSGINSFCDNC